MKPTKIATAAVVALGLAIPSVQSEAATLVVDVANAQSAGALGASGNTVLSRLIGSGARVTGLVYDVTITAFDPSYLSEARLAFTDSGVSDGVLLTPGVGRTLPGTESYTGTLDLIATGLDFTVGTDGLLRLEFFESFNDSEVDPDGIWDRGTLTFTYDAVSGAVPEPAAWTMMAMGFGLTGAAMRRRRVSAIA